MQFTVADVFAGCGGFSLGIAQAGHDVVVACERDAWAFDTYAANLPTTLLHRSEIEQLPSSLLTKQYRGTVNLVVGGPPCQGFSVSGKRQYGEFLPSNRLVYEFVRVVEAIDP